MGSVLKYLNEIYWWSIFKEVKDHRYRILPTENNISRVRDEPESLRPQYQVQKETQIRKNEKVVENNGKLEIINYPKNKHLDIQHQQLKFKPPNWPSCKRKIRLEFGKGYYCQTYEYVINKQKHHFDQKNS